MDQSELMKDLQQYIEVRARQIAEDVYKTQGTQFGVSTTPAHLHNNIDSSSLPPLSIEGYSPLPATPGSILDPNFMGHQIVIQGDSSSTYDSPANVMQSVFPIFPIATIYGGGNSTAYTLTGSPIAGATTATLTGAYVGTTGTYATAFQSSEIKNVLFTNGSTALSWTTKLQYSGGGVNISLNGDSAFKGGDATLGTSVIFSAAEALIPEIWFRIDQPATIEKWWGIGFNPLGIYASAIIGLTI